MVIISSSAFGLLHTLLADTFQGTKLQFVHRNAEEDDDN